MTKENKRDNRRSSDEEIEELGKGIITSLFNLDTDKTLFKLDILDDPGTMYYNDMFTRMVLNYQNEDVAFSKFYRREEIEAVLYIITSLLISMVEDNELISDLVQKSDTNKAIHGLLLVAILTQAQAFREMVEETGMEKVMSTEEGSSFVMTFLDEFTSMVSEVRSQED